MFANTLQLLYRRTLNSVVFGISLMVLIALYIAIGSGRPDIRAYFELSDLQFFNAWPLKLLMLLLVLNLSVVTFERIPFTPPRYGVWTVHTGIVTLIAGMALYYSGKVEGTTRIPVGQTVDHFYDGAERSLYVKIDGRLANSYSLPSLPRYNAYGPELKNAGYLDRPDLRDILPTVPAESPAGGAPVDRSLKEFFGWSDDLKISIVGYYPYANIVSTFVEDAASDTVGLKVSMPDPHDDHNPIEEWVVASDPIRKILPVEGASIEHRHASAEGLHHHRAAAEKVLKIDASIASSGHKESLFVEAGKTYPIGQTGYSFTVETFIPQWPTMDRKIVPALTLKVKGPTQEFRRMILGGDALQTDFKLDAEAAGPMGARQKEPLDKDLTLLFTFDDPLNLMPRQGGAKHLLITTSDGPGLTHIATGGTDGTVVTDHPDGRAEIEIDASAGAGGPFMQAMRAQGGGGGDGHDHGPIKATVVRHDHLRLDESVQIVPPAQRDRNMGDLGVFQVARARVTKGDWSHDVLVPYAQDVVENRWDGAPVRIPGTSSNLHLQLGQTRLQMPARITLNNFELVPYPGGEARQGSMFRDFKSTLTIENPRTGEEFTALAHMNNPVYFTEPGSVPVLGNFLPFKRSWLFFQAAYDPERQAWTILGVGNRPGVWVMTAGCVMIFVGLMYAFYVKPIIIRRMKANALAKAAQAAGKVPPKKRPADQAPELAAASS